MISLRKSSIFPPTYLVWCLTSIKFHLTVNLIYLSQHLCYFRRLVLYGGEGNGTPLQYSCLENPMDGGAWWAAVHGVAKSRTRLSDFTFTFHFPALATHSSVLAWRIPGTAEPGGLPSLGSHRVGCDWSDLAAAAVRYGYYIVKRIGELLRFQIYWHPHFVYLYKDQA